ncbi:single-stranded DNA-binding protein [Lacibacter sp. MH-610]|uniref:single-stranded DNA-binding protein n=1 Tax=Lacibacter sp. MH-610 TaxID=3020883 RepID=UPI0038929F85
MLKAQIIGHLGQDATVNNVNGKQVINFSVAHSETWKDTTGEKKSKTVWVSCSYWTDKTGLVPYLTKGTQVYVEGMPEARTYAKNDGTTVAQLQLRVGTVQLLSSGNNNAAGNDDSDNTPERQYEPVTQQQMGSGYVQRDGY